VPIAYDKNDRRRLVTITIVDPFSYTEFLDLVDRQWAEGAWDYAVLYDSRGKGEAGTLSEIQALAERVQSVGQGRPRGPVGLIVPRQSQRYAAGVLFCRMCGPQSEIEVMLTDEQVDAWVRREAPLRPAAASRT
jgi:hypothetical protein